MRKQIRGVGGDGGGDNRQQGNFSGFGFRQKPNTVSVFVMVFLYILWIHFDNKMMPGRTGEPKTHIDQ